MYDYLLPSEADQAVYLGRKASAVRCLIGRGACRHGVGPAHCGLRTFESTAQHRVEHDLKARFLTAYADLIDDADPKRDAKTSCFSMA